MNIGIDIGSREVKIYVNLNKGSIMDSYSTIDFYQKFGINKNGKFMIDSSSLGKMLKIPYEDFNITATGYGKNNLLLDEIKTIPEIQAHTKGAIAQSKLDSFTLLDIGGQDIKVIFVKDSVIEDFTMNDKCAAGTGRYLENIAKILNVDIKDMGNFHKSPIELNHTCAIFGETEVVTKIAEGYPVSSLCSGANSSVAKRIIPLINRFNNDNLVIVGGVAKNSSVIHFLSKELTSKIIIPPLPQFNGAIGCT